MNNIINSNDPEYWSLLKNFNIGTEWRSSVYSKCKLAYYRQRPLDEGKKLDERSFLLQWEKNPVLFFFGAMVEDNNKIDLLCYEAPCILIENKLNLTTKATKTFLSELDKILDQVNGKVCYRDYIVDGSVSCLTTHLLRKGATINPILSKVINLSLDKEILWKGIRKSYSSLINNGLRDMKPYVITRENIVWEGHMLRFRELHMRVSGRETRSIESWKRQFESVKNGEAFLVLGELEGEIVTAGYFSHSKENCIYGSSVSRRDLFHKPLFHAVMWTAILYAKKIGCRWFEVGNQNFIKHPRESKPTQKELGISDFKSGFGGETKVCLDVRLNLEEKDV